MKRTPMPPRQSGLKRTRRKRMSNEEKAQAWEFKLAGAGPLCLVCGRLRPLRFVDAHHVVYEQHLTAEQRWDRRNALSVCRKCHDGHHAASRRIPLSALTEDNWAFAREVFGEAAEDYLRARYSPEEGT